MRRHLHREHHRTDRTGWLRAAVLGANDGIVSTASLVLGVAASGADHGSVVTAGLAGLVAGAMSMAAGEYVSVHSQADTEKADLAREAEELLSDPTGELRELTAIYVKRGLKPALARQVAAELMSHDALGAHARDELGIATHRQAAPLQAAATSAASFAVGALLPLVVAMLTRGNILLIVTAAMSIVFLAILGGLAAQAGGAGRRRGAWRVASWGAIAMLATAGVGRLFGTVV
ncbi:conserved membrane hypothetical protein [Burkholderiales bacterium 8X]|nr:conserved membrane hypothetical protein [Burkholderiales bacterium 8X]